MVEITINNEVFHPDIFTPGFKFVSTGNTVTTTDGATHAKGKKIKRELKCDFKDISRSELARLLQAVCTKHYFYVKYIDPISNVEETRVFELTNDLAVPVKIWKNLQYYDTTSVILLEKGAERIC
jgi:hypothetical protein